MKPFSFDLQPVLAYRRLLEDGEQARLQTIDATIHRARQVMASLMSETARYSQMLASHHGSAVDVHMLRNLVSYLEKLKAEVSKTALVLSKLEEDKRIQMDKLVKAKRASEVVETLKDKKFTAHQKDILALEQKLLDEASAARFLQQTAQFLPADEADSNVERS